MIAPHLVVGGDELCQTEIKKLYLSRGGEKDVRRFDVAVNDAFFVRRLQPIANLNCNV